MTETDIQQDIKSSRVEILLLFMLYLFILPRAYMEYDMGFWREWALIIHRQGLSNAYNSSINYFPLYVYGLYFYDLLQGTETSIISHINSIKMLFVFFDFLPLFVLCGFRQRILSFKIPHLYLLLNIAYVFNSMVWGQLDSIYTNLSFLAIVTGFLYPVLSVTLYTLALYTKPQAIEFIPVLALVWLYSCKHIKTIVAAVAASAAIQLLLLSPFLFNGGVSKLAYHAVHSVGLYNKLSICAFNMWYIIEPKNPYFINDRDTFFLLSYQATGLLLFTAATFFVWWPLAKKIWQIRQAALQVSAVLWQQLFLGTGLICLYFFYFNSQMHERYANPIIIFFFFYGATSKNYKLYVLASIPYFLSLDKCFPDYLPIVHYKLIFASRIIAIWYTATLIYGSYLYFQFLKKPAASDFASATGRGN